MVNCENPKCGKVLKLRPGQKRLNPKRRFCDSKCATRHRSYKIFLKLRNDPEYRKKKNK